MDSDPYNPHKSSVAMVAHQKSQHQGGNGDGILRTMFSVTGQGTTRENDQI